MELREITYLAIALRLVVAVICGGALGLERGMKNRPAGMRTYMLVCVGSCLIMLTNQYLFQVTQTGDPMRLGAQVVSGIGFLGAGTIVVTRHNRIKGLTTAAGLWSSAGVGLALGVGFYEAALIAGLAIFVVMTLLQRWDDNLHSKARAVEIYVELAEGITLGAFIQGVRALELDINNVQIERSGAVENGCELIATLKSKKRRKHDILMAELRQIEGVRYIEEL
jgi:putative Mg2+ transporter-C (MgtC) family protein